MAAVLTVLTWQAYAPGLNGPFLVDDFPNITTNDAIKVDQLTWDSIVGAAASGRTGPLGRPVSMASFAADHALSGLDPSAFKRTNVLIHLLCGLLVARLAFLLSGRVFWRQAPSRSQLIVSIAVAAAWLLHPLQLTNVLYVVQRMNSLAGLFTLGACTIYASARFRPDGATAPLRVLTGAALTLLILCAVLSKENGILAIGYIAVIELVARYALPATQRSADRVLLAAAALGAVALTVGLFFLQHRLIGAYTNRDFTLEERLLTESRALLWYLRLTFLPDLTQMGLMHDDWVKSTSITQPFTTLASILGLLAMVCAAWLARFRWPVLLFGVLWFLVGHSMESTAWPLLLVFEHRNYVPLFGILAAAVLLGAQATEHWPRAIPAISAVLLTGALFGLTRERATTWSDDATWIQTQARNHPQSPSANYFKGILFAQFAAYVPADHRQKVIGISADAFAAALRLKPSDISPILARAYHWTKLGLPVDDGDLKTAAERLRRGNDVEFPTQNAVLSFCENIRDGAIPYRGNIHDRVFAVLMDNPRLSPYIAARLRPCAASLRERQTAHNPTSADSPHVVP